MALQHHERPCLSCGGVVVDLVGLNVPPRILFFQLATSSPVLLNKLITIPILPGGSVCYMLRVIIYFGGYHFSVCMYSRGKVWNYDGQVNDSRPYLEPTLKPGNSDLSMLTTFHRQVAHVCIYTLED